MEENQENLESEPKEKSQKSLAEVEARERLEKSPLAKFESLLRREENKNSNWVLINYLD